MAKCRWDYTGQCEAVATTTLTKNNGQVEPLCELHAKMLVILLKGVSYGNIPTHRENAQDEAAHWLVKNKIPS